jgi:hypothetical protein
MGIFIIFVIYENTHVHIAHVKRTFCGEIYIYIYMLSRKTKKRCPNGSRRDTKTDICVKYNGVKVFKELKDQKISETKTTISFESLEKNVILKKYENGELIEQKLIN